MGMASSELPNPLVSTMASMGMQDAGIHLISSRWSSPIDLQGQFAETCVRHVGMHPSARLKFRYGVRECMSREEGMIICILEKTSSNFIESSSIWKITRNLRSRRC